MSVLRVAGPIAHRLFEGDKICQPLQLHAHNYDHTFIPVLGRFDVRSKIETKEDIGVGSTYVVKAGVEHEIIPRTDRWKFLCVFSHRDFDGIVVENYEDCLGNPSAYN